MTLLAFIHIWWATAAAGAAAVAIPVIIHLINRRRFKIVPWAAMKFLLAAQKQTRKRMRIEQILLLVCRMAILALLLLAMAAVMPWAEEHLWGNPVSKFVLNNLGFGGFSKGHNRTHRIHHIFVLDASLSSNQKADADHTAFELAKQKVIKKIASNPSGDGYSVLMLKDSPTWLVGQASQDARKVTRAIEEAKPSHGNASIATAFSMISAKLNELSGRYKKNQAVYFFTDMQRSNWQAAAPSIADLRPEEGGKERSAYLDIQKMASTLFVDCGPEKDAANLAVTGLEFDLDATPYVSAGMDLILNASVENFGAEDAKDLRGEVLIGRARENANDPPLTMRVIGHLQIGIEADGPTKLSVPGKSARLFKAMKIRFPAAGTYAVQVKISDDALEQDNSRTIIITVRDTIPVLLVNGKASVDRFERATEYLRLALNPFPAGVEPPGFPLRPTVVDPGQFNQMTEAQLEKYDCIFWCDYGHPTGGDVQRIDTHLRRGGGFVVSLGDSLTEANIEHYNLILFRNENGLLPARLMKQVKAPADHHFYLQNSDVNEFKKPPLAVFIDDQDKIALHTARFRKYVLASVPEAKARTILSFMPEVGLAAKVKRDESLPISAPAIVEWNPPLQRIKDGLPPPAKAASRADRHQLMQSRYRGKVILLTSTVNMDWTSWPGSPSFGAMMHELTRLAVSGRLREKTHVVGDVLDDYLPGSAEIEVNVFTPVKGAGPIKKKTQAIGEVNLFRFDDTDISGIYRVETKGFDLPFAVNVPTGGLDQKGTECDLARIDEVRLSELFPDWKFKVVKNATDAVLTGGSEGDLVVDIPQPIGPDMANILLLAVVALLFAEIIMAWMFGHYSTTEGALANAPAGPASITFAGVVAILTACFFAAWATVKLHHAYFGDFLGFLPDILRTYFEKAVGADPLLAGEGTRWQYQEQSFLYGLPGGESNYLLFLTIAAVVLIFFTYRAEAPRVSTVYKLLLGAVRLNLVLFVMWAILPRPELHYDRQSFPDLVILIDDSRSMGEPDAYQDPKVVEQVKKLTEGIRERLGKELPERIAGLEVQIAARKVEAQKNPDVKADVDALTQRLNYWEKQRALMNANKWRPSRLQLVQAILSQPEPHWLKTILTKEDIRAKVHVFHLDAQGRATKLRDDQGDAGDLIDPFDNRQIDRTIKAILALEPVGNDSRLGTALKQVIDHYRGSGLSNVIMLTDGVTTRDENIVEGGAYAAQKGVPLIFIGIGDEQELRDLKLHDMQAESQVYVGDNIPLEVRLTGKGYKDLTVTVVLRVEEKDGKERELKRVQAKVDPSGQSTRLRFEDQPKQVGKRKYIIQVEPPKLDNSEKPITPANLRQERTVDVIDSKQINVLYVEGQPRYEFRYIKFLMEREAPDEKQKKKSIELKVLLLEADDNWSDTDKTALTHFPPTLKDLNKYDVLILGDCDPRHKKLQNSLKDIVAFARGEDDKGKKGVKLGGGVLFLAGSGFNPHSYKNTPLADILPVEPSRGEAPRDMVHKKPYMPRLTPLGEIHPIFRFRQDPGESLSVYNKLTKIYWGSTDYKAVNAAEVLAVHPDEKSQGPKNDNLGEANADRHPLVVQRTVGNQGRSLFFGFDESWRWRLREDEAKFNHFWIQTMRYLSRTRPTQTDLVLDRQIPYHPGDDIKVTVTFPDSAPVGNQPGPKITEKTEVKVTVTYLPPDTPESKDSKDPKRESDVHTIQLAKSGSSLNKYEGKWSRTREGRYIFRLTDPDVTKSQPDGKKPSAEATVELPPGELDRLRMNWQEMTEAASKTQGEFFTLANADEAIKKLRPGSVTPIASNMPPTLLWNQWWIFIVIVVLITSEWILRKQKHLL